MKKVKVTRNPILASEYKAEGSNDRMVGSNGELNAYSKRDLWNRQQKFIQAAANGQIAGSEVIAAREEVARNREMLKAAFHDGNVHKVLGERVADALYIAANRRGFARKYQARIEVQQGAIPRFPVRMKNVTAVYSTSPTRIETQITRDKWLTPPELQIVARPFVTQNELNQSVGDVLEEKYIEALEALMVSEDRLWYRQANETVGIDNNLTVVSGNLTPYVLVSVRVNVDRWGLKVPHVLIASDLYNDIIGDDEFYTAMDPVARHELLLTGEIGTMYGMTVTSDAYRHAPHKVLARGEFFCISEALNHGAYSDRGGIESLPTDINTERIPGKGWILSESYTSAIANSRSVAKGIRV